MFLWVPVDKLHLRLDLVVLGLKDDLSQYVIWGPQILEDDTLDIVFSQINNAFGANIFTN